VIGKGNWLDRRDVLVCIKVGKMANIDFFFRSGGYNVGLASFD
jgi:hypothetical protein